MNTPKIKKIIEAALFCSEKACTVEFLLETVLANIEINKKQVYRILMEITADFKDKGINLIETAAGFRYVSTPEVNEEIGALWEERAPRYSRALLETLALIAYKQPITKVDIESIRGVGVAHTIMRTLIERDWIKIVGHKEVPGRPALYGTTKNFLEYFNLKTLEDMPELNQVTYEMLATEYEQQNLALPFDDEQPEPIAQQGEANAK